MTNITYMEENTADKAPNRDFIIGVTGHRWMRETKELISAIDLVIGKIIQIYPGHLLNVLSPLAEGADRVLAKQFLCLPGIKLTAILPINLDEYVKDFSPEESKMEFHRMLNQSDKIITLPHPSSRDEGYLAVGRYIVDHCDLLVAIWDGKVAQGRGGTGEIVHLARERNLPLAWICHDQQDHKTRETNHPHENKGRIRFERFPSQSSPSHAGEE